MPTEDIKISIITPCYNSAESIKKTLDSVIRQRYLNMEHIIVDGKSSDGTLEIVNNYKNTAPYKVRIISEKDNGIYDAMNKGIRYAEGELIGIINSDDWYEDNALNKIIQCYTHNKYEIVYGMLKLYKDNTLKTILFHSHEFIMEQMICHPTCFVTKSTYDDFGYYDEKLRSSADYEWMIKNYKSGSVIFTPVFEVIANMSLGGMSGSNIGYRETLNIQRKNGQISFISWVFYTAKSYVGDIIRGISKK